VTLNIHNPNLKQWSRQFEIFDRLKKKLPRFSNFMYRYMDDVLSLNNSMLDNFVHRIYLIEIEIKDTTYTARSASYLELYLDIDTEGRLRMKLYYCNYPIVNFPFICNNIQSFWFTCSHRLINYLTFQIFDYDLL
jgi:hypothetical protein